jgi:hypothetical protein
MNACTSPLDVVRNVTALTTDKVYMRQLLLFCLLLFTCIVYSQTLKKQSLELTAQIRREMLADYTTQFGTVSYQNALQLYGTSFGFDLGYKRTCKGDWFIKPSIGYHKFTVDKITNNRIPARPNDPSRYRPIDYRTDSIPIGYSTSKYHYNNIAFGIAFGKAFYLNNNLSLATDFAFTYLTTFSQHYKVRNGYTTTNNKRLGYLIDYRIGVQREFKNLFLTTNFTLPLYKQWRQDKVFLENPDSKVDTWFGGYGLALTIGKYLR